MLAVALGVRVLLLFVAAVAVRGAELPQILTQWDANNYMRLAEVGYRPLEAGQDGLFIVFYPLFPALVALIKPVTGLAVGAFVINWVASAVALTNLRFLGGTPAVIVALVFPTAFFMSVPYTEALFLATTTSVALGVKRGNLTLSAPLAAAACATRVNGLALIPAFLWSRRRSLTRTHIAWAAVAGSGFVAYLALNWVVNGDAFSFLGVQSSHWHQKAVWPWIPFIDGLKSVWRGDYDTAFGIVYWGRILAAIGAVAVVVAGRRALESFDRAYFTFGFVMVTSAAWLISLPRYVGGLYPLYVAGGRLAGRRWLFGLVCVLSAWVQVWLFTRYIRGEWSN